MERPDERDGRVQLEIFLVEDNPGDVVLFKQALRKSSVLYSLTGASDGVEAVRRLQETSGSQPPYRPDVIFLDLNLPGWSGAEILAQIKKDPQLAAIPVAILTGSELIQDRTACAALGVDAFFNKATALHDFFSLAKEIERFLLGLPWVPRRQSPGRARAASVA
ncbi:MAG: response regulator [Acidobacteriaceae bacterium]|nr:response regulator [Acidobacteriaceae bacterium]